MKMKHNKKRNTAFLYECLLKELTKTIVKNQNERKQKIISIIKEFFYKGSPLREELDIYKSILESKKMTESFARRFLIESRKDFQSLDRKEIFNSQTTLIKSINESLSPLAFANFISNYKEIASVGSFLDSKMKAKSRLLIENRLLSSLTQEKTVEVEMRHVDNLSYKTFVDKFNKTYDRQLHKEQKDLLTNYITSFADNGLGLKSFINEEIYRLKNEISAIMLNEKKSENSALLSKLEQVYNKLENFSKRPINERAVRDVFYIQNLIQEVKS